MGIGVSSPGAIGAQSYVRINPCFYTTVVAGTWAVSTNTGQLNSNYMNNTSGSQNDQIDFEKVYLSAGSYQAIACFVRINDQGICSILLDDVSVGTIDTYGALALNIIADTTFTVGSSGLKKLSLKAATKNGASSAYNLSISEIAIFRTA